MYYIYIIQSLKDGRHYIGHSKDLENRLQRHNSGKVKSTKFAKPWKIIYVEHFNTKSEAYRRELQIKSYKGGMAFKNLINYGSVPKRSTGADCKSAGVSLR